MATTLTTKIASLIAAFGVAIGTYKVFDATQVDPNGSVRMLPRDDGQGSGNAASNPFGVTNRAITDDDLKSETAAQAWINAAMPGQYDHVPEPRSISEEKISRTAKYHYDLFKEQKASGNASSIDMADNLRAVVMSLDFRNIAHLGGDPKQLLKDLKFYSNQAYSQAQDQLNLAIDPVDKILLLQKMPYYIENRGINIETASLNATKEDLALVDSIHAQAVALVPDVLRITLQRLEIAGDIETMTPEQSADYLRNYHAMEAALNFATIIESSSAQQIQSDLHIPPQTLERIRNNRADLIMRMQSTPPSDQTPTPKP